MGTWGPGIFSDDLASDVRGDWRDAIASGSSPEEATRVLIEKYDEAISDPDDGSKFWFALAASQAATGRLQDAVRDRALAIIEAGGDVSRFAAEDPALGRKREAALRKLAVTLRGPQKPPTRLVQPKPQKTPLVIGDVIRVRGENGLRTAYFAVIAIADAWPRGSTWPVLAGLLWDSAAEPSADDLRRRPFLMDDRDPQLRGVPAIDVHVMAGPTRGPRSWDKFAAVVQRGIRRSDAPKFTPIMRVSGGATVGITSWETLSMWIDSDWLKHQIAVTESASARSKRGRWSSPWRR